MELAAINIGLERLEIHFGLERASVYSGSDVQHMVGAIALVREAFADEKALDFDDFVCASREMFEREAKFDDCTLLRFVGRRTCEVLFDQDRHVAFLSIGEKWRMTSTDTFMESAIDDWVRATVLGGRTSR